MLRLAIAVVSLAVSLPAQQLTSAPHGRFRVVEGRRCHEGRNFTDGAFHNTAIAERQTARFRTPTLRNIELTAPYMHDGSIATMEDVVEEKLKKLSLTRQNKLDLVEFLKALTDREVLTDQRFSDPW